MVVARMGQMSGFAESWGPGFDPATLPRTRRGIGLVTMRERAQEIGARLDIRSREGAGTTVTVSVPIGASR